MKNKSILLKTLDKRSNSLHAKIELKYSGFMPDLSAPKAHEQTIKLTREIKEYFDFYLTDYAHNLMLDLFRIESYLKSDAGQSRGFTEEAIAANKQTGLFLKELYNEVQEFKKFDENTCLLLNIWHLINFDKVNLLSTHHRLKYDIELDERIVGILDELTCMLEINEIIQEEAINSLTQLKLSHMDVVKLASEYLEFTEKIPTYKDKITHAEMTALKGFNGPLRTLLEDYDIYKILNSN